MARYPDHRLYCRRPGIIIGTPTLVLASAALGPSSAADHSMIGGFLLAAITYYPLYSWLRCSRARPGRVNYPVAIIIVAIMVVGYVGGVLRADRVRSPAEIFPGGICYTAVSVPYLRSATAGAAAGCAWHHDGGFIRRPLTSVTR